MPFGPTEGLQRDWKVKQDLAGKGNNCYHFYADANPPHVHTKTTNNSVDLSDLMSGQAKKEAKFQGHKSLPQVTQEPKYPWPTGTVLEAQAEASSNGLLPLGDSINTSSEVAKASYQIKK